MFAALLDTCTLWPSLRRDVLLSFAAEGLYRPLWSTTVLEELQDAETQKLIRRGASPVDADLRAVGLIASIRRAFDDGEVPEVSYEALEGTFGLPDSHDEHVVAAAAIGGAGVIVTENLKDFPPALFPFGMAVSHPNEFLFDSVQIDALGAARAIGRIAARSGRVGPQMTFDDVRDALQRRYGADDCVRMLQIGPRPQQPHDRELSFDVGTSLKFPRNYGTHPVPKAGGARVSLSETTK